MKRGDERMQALRYQLRKRISWLNDRAAWKGRESFDAKHDRLTCEYLHEMLDPKNGSTPIDVYFAAHVMPHELPDEDTA